MPHSAIWDLTCKSTILNDIKKVQRHMPYLDRYHQSITEQFYKVNTLIFQYEFCIFSKLFHSTK